MLVLEHLGEELADRRNFWLLCLCYLDEDHRQSDQGALSHEVSLIIRQGSEKFQSFSQAGSCAADTDGHRSTIAKVRVIALSKMLHSFWDLLGVSEKQEAQVGQGSSLHVIADIRHCKVEKLLDCLAVLSASVRAANREHTTVAHDCILASRHLLNEPVCGLLFALHEQCQRDA